MPRNVRKIVQQRKRKSPSAGELKDDPQSLAEMKLPLVTSFEAEDERGAFVARLRKVADQLGGGRALARAAGVFPSTARAWFNSTEPGRPALQKIARVANVSLDWLVLGDGNYARLRFHDLKQFPYAEAWFAKKETTLTETRLFDLSSLSKPPLLQGHPFLRPDTWTNQALATADLFMVQVDGCGRLMEPLISDGDLIVASQGFERISNMSRQETYPCVIAHHGRVIVRLICYGQNFTAIGATDASSWPPKMAWPPEHMMKGIAPAPPIGEFFPMGRVIWCGRSLLSLDFD